MTHLNASNLLNFDSSNRFLPIASQSWCSGVSKLATYIRALASARGSVARRAQRPSRKPLEGPKGPRVAKTRESEGPKGPRTSKAQSALASATICFSRFSQKSRFSWHNLSTFMTAKMHENFNRVLYLRYEHCVKK